MNLTEEDYSPNEELLKRYFNFNSIHLRFPYFLPNYIEKFDLNKFQQVWSFCEKWDIDSSFSSNIYCVISKIIPAKTLDAFQEIGKENLIAGRTASELNEFDPEKLTEIVLRVKDRPKGIIIRSREHLNKIGLLVKDYISQFEAIENYKFRSNAYEELAKSFNRYFLDEKIGSSDFNRYVIIGRLFLLASLPVRINQPPKDVQDEKKSSRIDLSTENKDYSDKELADVIRNYIKKKTPIS